MHADLKALHIVRDDQISKSIINCWNDAAWKIQNFIWYLSLELEDDKQKISCMAKTIASLHS
jgi:hypothetical protein